MKAESKIELTRNALSSADALIRWAIVLNGAAAAGLLSFIGNAIDKQAFFHGWESFGMSLLIFSTDSLSMLAPTFSHHPADKHCTILPAAGGGCPAASTI